MIFKTVPSGLSCRNSNAAVSCSINEILIYSSSRVSKQRIIKVGILLVEKRELSISFAIFVFLLARR